MPVSYTHLDVYKRQDLMREPLESANYPFDYFKLIQVHGWNSTQIREVRLWVQEMNILWRAICERAKVVFTKIQKNFYLLADTILHRCES